MTWRRARRLAHPRRTFSDSSAFLALVNPRDQHHQEALAISTQLVAHRWRAYTTNFVVAETHALFLSRLGHRHATAFVREIRNADTTILRIAPPDEARAEEIILTYQDKLFSYTDATSFAVMERLRISSAFTFDRDFAQFGFTVLASDQF